MFLLDFFKINILLGFLLIIISVAHMHVKKIFQNLSEIISKPIVDIIPPDFFKLNFGNRLIGNGRNGVRLIYFLWKDKTLDRTI